MLYVTQKNWYTKRDVPILTCETIKEVYDQFAAVHGGWNLERMFSHNPLAVFGQLSSDYGIPVPHHCYVITNSDNIRYSCEYIKGCFRKIRNPKGDPQYWRYHNGFKHHCRCINNIRTTQERKLAVIVDEDEPPIRSARNAVNLPNSWDDRVKSDWRDKNWKNYRKHQWK